MKKRDNAKPKPIKRHRKQKQSMLFANNLAFLLEKNKWTHAEAAMLAGVSQATLTAWINGRAQPYDYECVLKLAEKGGMDFAELLTGKKKPQEDILGIRKKLPNGFENFELEDQPEFEGAYWITARKIKKKVGASK